MGEVLKVVDYLKRNSTIAMFVVFVVFLVVSRAGAGAYAQEQAMSTAPTGAPPPFPLLDLFTGTANYYPDHRKTYSDSYVSCPKSDSLGSFANILGSAAKIMMSVAAILFLKFLMGKLMLFPLSLIVFAKLGLKTVLLWPMISKMIKYFKKKKLKKGKENNSRIIKDCSERISCVIQRSSREGLASHMGAAAAFAIIDDIEEDTAFSKVLLSVLSSDKVSKCMSVECTSGIDLS